MKLRNIVSFLLIAVMLAAVMFSAYSCTDNPAANTTDASVTVKETEGKTEEQTDATVTEEGKTEPPTDAATEPGKTTETEAKPDTQTEAEAKTDEATTEIETDPATEPATEPPTTEAPVTDPPHTEPPVTDPPHTEPPHTEPPVTDKPTEPVTEAPGPEPDPDNIFKTWNDSVKTAFKATKQTTASISEGAAYFKYAKASGAKDPYVTFDIAAYIKATGRKSLKGSDGSYLVFKYRSLGGDGVFEVFTQTPAAGDSSIVNYVADDTWRYIVVDMTQTTFVKASSLTTMRIDWSAGDTTATAYMYISEIGFFETKADAYEYAGLSADQYSTALTKVSVPSGADVTAYAYSTDATLAKKTVERAPAIEVTTQSTSANVLINVNTLAAYQNAHVKKGRYVVIYFKTSIVNEGKATMTSLTDASGLAVRPVKKTFIDQTNKGWQGVLFDTKGCDGRVEGMLNFSVEFSYINKGTKIYIRSITVTDDLNEALTDAGHSEYKLNYDASLSENDPLANKVLKADKEDATLSLWFDQSTEKTYREDTVSTGRTGYTIRMAKNEAENCQFFLAPQKAVRVRVELDPFTDSKGNTVQAELAYEYYHNINNILIPDALPELQGALDIPAGVSQGFVIRVTTLENTPAGTYNSTVHVYDDATGNEIKRAAVAVKVWDFALSEETELRTAFALWMSYVYDSYPSSRWSQEELSQLEDNYYQFFLKYRVNIMDVPHGLTSSRGGQYMSNPRVNTARWNNLDMSVTEDNNGITPDWMSKVIYYPGELDEPGATRNDSFVLMIDRANRIKQNTPDYRMVIPFERDLYITADGKIVNSASSADFDSIGFMSQYVNIWCPKLDAFTTRDLSFISGASFLQSREQDAKYGNFIDRMKAEVAGGDELWAYVCINPVEPYANWQILNDGTETIVSIWQLKEYNCTGLLYWAVSYWKVNYWGTAQPWTGSAFGDGILIYSGHTFGSLYPVPTLRLENIRDGIEDYQMLCMLEQKLGTQALNDMISRISTSIITYASDDDYIHAVRILLGDMLEAAYKN